jgi:glycosyltransferase involved in cell wall biosynthesis
MSDVSAVSVVIPLYNKGPYIARALKSVLAQTFQDFEVIVVDDGSTDGGAEVVRGFDDPRIRLIQQENLGVSAARNRGIAAARAELVAFLDADDEWLSGFLETIMRMRREFPEAGAYVTAFYTHGRKRSGLLDLKAVLPEPWEGLIPRYFLTVTYGGPISSSSVCIPRSIFDDIGMFIEGVWWGEDTEMWGRIALHYTIAFSWTYGAVYHFEATNRANEKRGSVKEHPFTETGLKYISGTREPISPILLQDLLEYIEKTKLQTAGRALKSGEQRLARKILNDCHTKLLKKDKIYIYILSYIPKKLFFYLRTIKNDLF